MQCRVECRLLWQAEQVCKGIPYAGLRNRHPFSVCRRVWKGPALDPGPLGRGQVTHGEGGRTGVGWAWCGGIYGRVRERFADSRRKHTSREGGNMTWQRWIGTFAAASLDGALDGPAPITSLPQIMGQLQQLDSENPGLAVA